jgi:hypothetical protein
VWLIPHWPQTYSTGFKKLKQVSFVAGQPLGYYASWPLFALSHHILIWWCAEQVYPFKHFKDSLATTWS